MQHTDILKNGIRLITVPMPEIESVSVQVFVRVGGRDESREKMGISHFLEHTVFKGTKKRPTMQAISEEVERIGGYFNAGTGEEYTVFYIKVPKERVEIAFDVLSDSLFNSLFNPKSLEKEKRVIIEEINVYEDIPMQKVDTVFGELIFPNHPLGYDLAGTKQTVMALTRDDLLGYMHRYYAANNIVIAVAGNVTHEKAKKYTQHYFGSRQKSPIPALQIFHEQQSAPRSKVFTKVTDQTHLCLGVKAFSGSNIDRFKLKVLNAVLGGGASSRLFESIREKEGLCYYIHSDVDVYMDTGAWYVKAGVDNARALRAVKLIMNELMKIRNSRVTQKELSRAKEYLKGGLKLSLESSDAQGNFYAVQELLKGEIMTVDEICREIDNVTSDDLLAVAQQLLVTEQLNLALIGPFTSAEEFDKLLQFKQNKR